VFGFDPDMHYKLVSIAPSAVPGIAEITMDVQSARVNGTQKLFVLSDRKHAVGGQLLDFPGQSGTPPTEPQINQFVRQMTMSNPAVTWTITQNRPNVLSGLTEVTVLLTTAQGRGTQRFWVTADGTHALVGELLSFASDPYAATRAQLLQGMNGPSRGPADAPVTIVEFADLQCPACKMAEPIVEKLLADEPQARYVFQQFPLTQIHNWALKAAAYGDCVAQENNPSFWAFAKSVFDNQEQIDKDNADQKLAQLAQKAGANASRVASCAAAPATTARINKSIELANRLEVTGTPTLFIGGRRVNNLGQIPYDLVKKMVEFMARPAAK
jgi:protein-disulfide isomerase